VRYFAVLQKVKDRGKRSRLCLRIDRFSQVLIVSQFRVLLLFNGGQFSLQYPQSFQSEHPICHAPPAFSSAKSY